MLANLVAAAIIYLVGVWAGAFPSIGELVYAATALLSFVFHSSRQRDACRLTSPANLRMRARSWLLMAAGMTISSVPSAYFSIVEGRVDNGIVIAVGTAIYLPAALLEARRLFRQADQDAYRAAHEWSTNPRAYL